MSIEKNLFNNNLFQSNDCLINSRLAPNARRNNQKYLNKNFYQMSKPNQTVNFNQNIILPSEQSTLLTSEDCQYKKINIVEEKRQRNNCICLCHQIEEELLNQNCKIVCYHTPVITSHPNCLKKHKQIYRSVENSLSRNNKPNQNKNFELIYNYQKLKKEYNIKNCTNYNNRDERMNNFNYTTDIKDKYGFSRNMLKPTHKHLNRSWDDCKVNYDYNACNYLLRRTRTILGYPSFSMDYKYGYCNHRQIPISYITDDYCNNISPLSQRMNNIYENRDRKNYNPKSKSIDYNPLYNNYTFKGKNRNNNFDENNINNQMIQNERINDSNNINNSKNYNEGRGNLNNTFNNNLIKDNLNSKINPKFNNSLNKSEVVNNKYINNKKEKSPKMHNIKCNNNNILVYNNNNISFGNEQENEDNTNQLNQNNNIEDKKIYGNNNNINKNKNLKDIIMEKNLFMKVKNKDKINKTKENNLNDNIDPNKKLIKDILNIKSDKNKNNAKNKKQNTRYLDYQNSNVDSIIEKILEKNHGKNKENKYKRNYNNKKIDILKKGKLNYTNTYKNKIGKKFGLPSYTKFTEFYNFKEKQKQKQPNNITKKDNQIKNKKITSKTPIKENKEIPNVLNKVKNDKDKNNITKISAKEKPGRNNNRSQSTLNNEKSIKNKTTNKNNNNIIKQNNNNNNTKNKNYPYLNIMHLNKINKLIHNSRFQNSILYNNIIQPYNNSKTLQNNNLPYKKYNINLQNKNINENDNLDAINENNIIKEKDELFNLTAPNKDKTLKTCKSGFIENNRYNLGNENQLTRNLSANLGSCFACYFGCSVSRSGYSPMNYSPYDGRKRHDSLGIPSYILYKFGNKYIS